ncbi:MAG: ATP-binding protein [Acidimicrobiales bacterium]
MATGGWLRLTAARVSPPTRGSLLKGLLAYRWLTVAWAAAVYAGVQLTRRGQADAVAHPAVGYALVAAAVAFTSGLSLAYRRRPGRLVEPAVVLAEIGLGTAMLLADNWVHGSIDHPNTLPSVWVVGAVGAVAVAGGRRAAVVTGAGMGLARLVGLLPYASWGRAVFTGASTVILLSVSGWVMGYLLHRLAEADRSISAYRAREEVARTLHDGVLQTLAVIQRRSADAELVTLARAQERELRDYLFGSAASAAGPGFGPGAGAGGRPVDEDDLGAGLRAAARRAEERYGLVVQVVLAPDLPPSAPGGVAPRVAAAVGEALTNAAKHGSASRATVYAEPTDDGGLFVSVKDDGAGFDPATVVEGQGLTRSIRGRLAEVGGRVEIDSRPGRGAEIRLLV